MNHTAPLDADTRYLELDDRIDRLVQAVARPLDDRGTAQTLTTLAQTTGELAQLSTQVHDPRAEADLIAADRDTALVARQLADLAAARIDEDRLRTTGVIPQLENHTYTRAVLDQMAASGVTQPSWVYAHQLNVLIDRLIDATDLDTDLAQRLALAVSHRPDGENPADDQDTPSTHEANPRLRRVA